MGYERHRVENTANREKKNRTNPLGKNTAQHTLLYARGKNESELQKTTTTL